MPWGRDREQHEEPRHMPVQLSAHAYRRIPKLAPEFLVSLEPSITRACTPQDGTAFSSRTGCLLTGF